MEGFGRKLAEYYARFFGGASPKPAPPVLAPIGPPMPEAEAVRALHATLQRRDAPETIAGLIARVLPANADMRLTEAVRTVASSRSPFGWSSMSNEFRQPVPMQRQLAKARELALVFLSAPLPQADGPHEDEATVDAFAALIGKPQGDNSFKENRKDRAARAEAGLKLSRRRYSKLFRHAVRLENRVLRLRNEEAKLRLVLISKSAFASELGLDQLGDSLPTAAFIAYYAARMKLRSEFTIGGQQRPFDELSAALLRWCESDPGTRWFAIAHIFTRADVLAHLDDRDSSHLLARSFDTLQELADRLDLLRRRGGIDVDTMIVRRGNDSSTWNTLAGAWNRARDHWIALIDGLGMNDLFEAMLPGKVMRLMAADVAHWHRSTGGAVHPDTLVWQSLPKPWAVLAGEARCTKADVEAACRAHGVDPERSGWSAPRARTTIANFRPTPELVHGVTVQNPYLAQYFRQRGVFSGRPLKSAKLLDPLD